ncbi:MAG: hypothetical protein H7242_04615 [Microbacteriaceae bacterium]|nr:hypothetical protein [Burkholderiaceae bacterium]
MNHFVPAAAFEQLPPGRRLSDRWSLLAAAQGGSCTASVPRDPACRADVDRLQAERRKTANFRETC